MKSGLAHNPFRVQRLGPDRISFRFSDPDEARRLMEKLEAAGWNGELCGPHGAGKSTLLRTLERAMNARGIRTVRFRCTEASPRLPRSWPLEVLRRNVCLLDGAGILRDRRVGVLRRWCRLHRCGLLLTTHEPAGHGVPIEVRPRPEVFRALVLALLLEAPGDVRARLERVKPEELLQKHCGDARSALDELYSLAEAAVR